MQLDLGSTQRTIIAKPELLGNLQTVTITTAANQKVVQTGALLTPAEFAAVTQVLSGHQSLIVDAAGRAIGGQLNISSIGSQTLGTLLVPQNVTALGGNAANSLTVSGLLSNYGSIIATTQNNVSTFTINAQQLFNAPGAIITTLTHMPINLTINTIGNVINSGTINASGALNIFAGGSVINATQAAASQAVMSAVQNATITSAIGNIVNSGTISSATGSLNLQSATASLFSINNAAGQLLARNGSVSVLNALGMASQLPKFDLNFTGGNIAAQAINFGTSGTINILADGLNGIVNAKGSAAHIAVQGGTLNLGTVDLSGDPSFVNLGGDVVLAPNVGSVLRFSGADLAVLASGSVTAPGVTSIDLSNAAGNGGNLFISAGLQPALVNLATNTYSLGGPSLAGGSILLAGTSINTASANGNAGNVTLAAHDNNNFNEPLGMGRIVAPSINATAANGTGGNILIVAQAGSLDLTNQIAAAGIVKGGTIRILGGEPISTGLVFTDGTQSGVLDALTNVAHDPVDMTFGPGAFFFSNALTGAQHSVSTTINTSGNITLAPGFTLASGDILIRSRAGGLTDSGVAQFASDQDLRLEAFGNPMSFGANSFLYGQNDLTIQSRGGALTLGANTLATAFGGTASMLSVDKLTFGNGVNLQSGNGNILESISDMNLGAGGSLFTLGSNIAVSGRDLTIGAGKLITSGLLRPTAPATGLLTTGDFTTFGGGYFIADRDLTINSSITTKGLDLAGVARTGNLDLGSGNTFLAIGGNVEFFAQGTVTGNNNTFQTRGVGQNNLFDGGVIQLSSGFSFNPFVLTVATSGVSAGALSLRSQILAVANNINTFVTTPDQPFTAPARDAGGFVIDPTIIGTPVQINNNGINIGLVLPTKLGGGLIDISGSQLNMKKGAVFLEAIGPGSSLQMQNSTFKVESYGVLPYAFTNTSFPALVTAALDRGLTPTQRAALTLPAFIINTDSIAQTNNRTAQFAIAFNESMRRESSREQSESTVATILGSSAHYSGAESGFSQIVDTGKTEFSRVSSVSSMPSLTSGQSVPLSITGGGGNNPVPVRVGEQRNDLVLFTTAGQVMTQVDSKNDGASVIGAGGTVMSSSDEKLILHVGRVFANSGSEPLEISTDFGSIVVPRGSSAAVLSEPGKPSRVVAFGGNTSTSDTLLIRPRGAHGEQFSIAAGEEASIELKPDSPAVMAETGASRSAAQPEPDTSARMVITRQKVNVAQLLDKDSFYSSSVIRLGGASRAAYQRLINNIAATSNSNRIIDTSLAFGLKDAEQPSRLLASEGTTFRQQPDDRLALLHGSLFIQAQGDRKITTELADIALESGSMVEVESTAQNARIRAFGDGTNISSGGRKIALLVGQELLLQRQKPTKNDSLPGDGIARRRLEQIHIADRYEAVLGEFSLFSALSSNQYFKPVRMPVNAADRRLASSLLKQTAALQMVTGRRGRYFVKPSETASVPGQFINERHFEDGVVDNPNVDNLEQKAAPEKAFASNGTKLAEAKTDVDAH